jgi:hypothetical protein
MGWWGIGQGDDIIGDSPADTIAETLGQIASSCEEQGKPKPTVKEALNAIASALRLKAADVVENGEEIFIQSLVAELEPTSTEVSGGENDNTDEALVAAFGKAIEEIARQYQDAVDRKPRLRELLASIRFVLGYEPSEYLSIEEDISVKKIIARIIINDSFLEI